MKDKRYFEFIFFEWKKNDILNLSFETGRKDEKSPFYNKEKKHF